MLGLADAVSESVELKGRAETLVDRGCACPGAVGLVTAGQSDERRVAKI